MLRQRYHLLAICLVFLSRAAAYMPNTDQFEAPSISIRGAMKAAIKHDYEDVVVMQTEMAWGAHEMKRYMSIKGVWPVRSSVSGDNKEEDDEEEDEGDLPFLRGNNTATDEDTDYWSYLVSIF